MARPSKLKILLLAFHLWLIPSLGITSAQKCQSALSELFIEPNLRLQSPYRPQFCADNIFYLLENIRKTSPHFDFESARVLLIYSRWTGAMPYVHLDNFFIPLRSRGEGLPRWGYHVVLQIGAEIIDFDYAENLRPVPLAEYFKTMFDSEWRAHGITTTYSELKQQFFLNDEYDETPGSILKLHLRAVPASVFLAEHAPYREAGLNQGRIPILKWITGTSRFPDQTLESYLLSQ
jgi:hypothetical protein